MQIELVERTEIEIDNFKPDITGKKQVKIKLKYS